MSEYIKEQIKRKNNYNIPYYATKNSITHTKTDMDHFPYTRFYRGVYNQSLPIVMDREAGFRHRQDDCYNNFTNVDESLQDTENDTSCDIASKML